MVGPKAKRRALSFVREKLEQLSIRSACRILGLQQSTFFYKPSRVRDDEPLKQKIREVIERRMFSQVEDLLPVISFGSKKDSDSEKKHDEFVQRMVERGYTERQVRRLVEWYMRVKKAG